MCTKQSTNSKHLFNKFVCIVKDWPLNFSFVISVAWSLSVLPKNMQLWSNWAVKKLSMTQTTSLFTEMKTNKTKQKKNLDFRVNPKLNWSSHLIHCPQVCLYLSCSWFLFSCPKQGIKWSTGLTITLSKCQNHYLFRNTPTASSIMSLNMIPTV